MKKSITDKSQWFAALFFPPSDPFLGQTFACGFFAVERLLTIVVLVNSLTK
jgi:hypothetical protein